MEKFKAAVAHIAARGKEPSSWAGLMGVLALVGVNVVPTEWSLITNVGVAACALLAFFLPEKAAA